MTAESAGLGKAYRVRAAEVKVVEGKDPLLPDAPRHAGQALLQAIVVGRLEREKEREREREGEREREREGGRERERREREGEKGRRERGREGERERER